MLEQRRTTNILLLIMAIPITVFVKIIFEQFQSTKILASLLSGKETTVQ